MPPPQGESFKSRATFVIKLDIFGVMRKSNSHFIHDWVESRYRLPRPTVGGNPRRSIEATMEFDGIKQHVFCRYRYFAEAIRNEDLLENLKLECIRFQTVDLDFFDVPVEILTDSEVIMMCFKQVIMLEELEEDVTFSIENSRNPIEIPFTADDFQCV
ncbi:hypothetical protein KIN20_015781 [Parelaphostrongylus tenuis]|uniref:Uncharacterized protein n=1 Tax=Parelaphostrongylus tenuis TaxID=148309 RepID=A0AAD5MFG6_PARTN|nr:hypothetical protein KIN20_015781 [Parelaphostrongylus tenuis]